LQWGVPFLLIAVALGGWIWVRAQTGLNEIEKELHATIDAEPWLPVQTAASQPLRASNNWQAQISPKAEAGELVTEMHLLDLASDWAVIQVVVQPSGGTATFRQTRVYQRGALGWNRIAATSAQWGWSHQLESRYFIFHYFTQDAATVEESADRLDLLYLKLHAAFFPEAPGAEKLVIKVDPAWTPWQWPKPISSQDTLVIASPTANLVPVEMAASDLLAQSVMLALFDNFANKATRRYNLPPHWRPLRNGLRLWLMWDQELPLAVWRKPLVTWVLWGVQTGALQRGQLTPEFAHDLCASYRLWMASTLELAVPVLCWQGPSFEEHIIAWRSHPSRLFEIPLPLLTDVTAQMQGISSWPTGNPSPQPVVGVPLATVIEYAATNFGVDRLPVLLAAFPEYESWETLIPAVFDVSRAEFDMGWHAFLAERYGITH
jgi:hypothetical protein